MGISIGFDIGGTFTDIVLHDERNGKLEIHKLPSTPDAPHIAVIAGLDELQKEFGFEFGEVEAIFHATTVATNAILERKGARVGLLTTAGFRDVALIGRQKRYDTYDMFAEKPRPLVQRRDIFEVRERIDADGEIEQVLDQDGLKEAVDLLAANEVEAIAVSFLNSFKNPCHEQAAGEYIASVLPQAPVSLSSEISPKIREYERTSTTLANAYVQPVIADYLGELQACLDSRGVGASLYLMQSNGGLISSSIARKQPVQIVESGPAAGVNMCASVGVEENRENLLTFDMGGTTAKLGAIDDGVPYVTQTFEVDNLNFRKHSGLPLNIAAVELLEIGAGGGSIASVRMGLIEVGPDSAGASPGPICYGFGGELPTVTDANLILGYLDPHYFNGGAMSLDLDAAVDGISQHIAQPLGISVEEAAWGIHTVANANMESAMRVVSIERGRDPREYTLVAFGGAGPLHASQLGRAIGAKQMLIPKAAGVGSAMGLLSSSPKLDVSVTSMVELKTDTVEQIKEVYDRLRDKIEMPPGHLFSGKTMKLSRYAYLRYVGQGYEVKVRLPDGPIDAHFACQVREAFNEEYAARYGAAKGGASVEAVDWHLVAEEAVDRKRCLKNANEREPAISTNEGGEASRRAYFGEESGFVECPVFSRDALFGRSELFGPVIVEDQECTTVVLPGDKVRITDRGHLVVDFSPKSSMIHS